MGVSFSPSKALRTAQPFLEKVHDCSQAAEGLNLVQPALQLWTAVLPRTNPTPLVRVPRCGWVRTAAEPGRGPGALFRPAAAAAPGPAPAGRSGAALAWSVGCAGKNASGYSHMYWGTTKV